MVKRLLLTAIGAAVVNVILTIAPAAAATVVVIGAVV